MWVAVVWSLGLGVLMLPGQGAAAAPPNDHFADALELVGLPAEGTGSNVDATREPGEPNHLSSGGGPGGARSVWFKWTAPTDAGVTVSPIGCAPPFDGSASAGPASMAVYARTDVFGLLQVANTSTSRPFRAEAGRTYWIAADTPADQPPDPDICVRLLPGPSNDDFARATPLAGFPVSTMYAPPARQAFPNGPTTVDEGGATREADEPYHGGDGETTSVWYSWAAPADGPVTLLACGAVATLGVYTGDKVDALTYVRSGQARGVCGSQSGARLVVNAVAGRVYRIAVASQPSQTPPKFQLLITNQVAVVGGPARPFFAYRALRGERDALELRLLGQGRERALLLKARGISTEAGCDTTPTTGLLRCPIPGREAPVLDIDLGDRDDRADILLLGPVTPTHEDKPLGHVFGGPGNDTLVGSAGSFSRLGGWSGGVRLFGGPGDDRVRGQRGFDRLQGGPGADRMDGGPGNDLISGGEGPDRIDAGAGRDRIDGGAGDDRMSTADGSSDGVACRVGDDEALLDGFDLPTECESRNRSTPARAIATAANIGDEDGNGEDRLAIVVACPADRRTACRARVTPSIPGERTISHRLKLAPGRLGVTSFFRGNMDRLVRRGVRVTVSTGRRGRPPLKYTAHLPVSDDRYEGE
jgi:hypothetical protein